MHASRQKPGAWRSTRRSLSLLILAAACIACGAEACVGSRTDRLVAYDSSGLWNPDVYRSVLTAASVAGIAGALWEGADTRWGKTMWQGVDAQIVAGVGAEAGKRIFTRARPVQADDPCLWFQGQGYDSFPSGETSLATALVMPYVLQYGAEHPAVYAMLALPAWIGAARVKNQQHWQSDVLAGWLLGGLSGWLSHSLQTPLTIQILPDGFAVGIKASF